MLPCRSPFCPELITRADNGYCDQHADKRCGWAARPSASARAGRNGSTRQWRKIRMRVLKRDMGCCVMCRADGKYRVGNECDHIDPNGGDTMDNLQTLCATHHAEKTARESVAARQ